MRKIVEGIRNDLRILFGNIRDRVRSFQIKKFLLANFPYLMVSYFGNKLVWLYSVVPGEDTIAKVMNTVNRMGEAFGMPLISVKTYHLLLGAACGLALKFAVYSKGKNAKKMRHGREYGSARWGNAKDIEPYMDPVFERNIPLTATERLMLNSRPKNPKYARNKNILVIGGSGSGKTRFFVKPSLMQMHSSYVVTDPKGYNDVGQRKYHNNKMRYFLCPT